MLNNDNGDQNFSVLLKVQGLRAGCVDQCMHSAKYKECRTSRIQGVQNRQGKVATTKANKRQRFREFEKTRRTAFGQIARVLGYLPEMPYKTIS